MVSTRSKKISAKETEDKKVQPEEIISKKVTKKNLKDDDLATTIQTEEPQKNEEKSKIPLDEKVQSEQDVKPNGNLNKRKGRGRKNLKNSDSLENTTNTTNVKAKAVKGKRKASKSPEKVDDAGDLTKKVKLDELENLNETNVLSQIESAQPNIKEIGTSEEVLVTAI